MATLSRQHDKLKIFAGPRQSGRTTALIRWAMEQPGRWIFVANRQRADNILGVCKHITQGKSPREAGFTVFYDCLPVGTTTTTEIGIDDYDTLPSNLVLSMPIGQIAAVTIESDQYRNIDPPVSFDDVIAGLQEIAADLR